MKKLFNQIIASLLICKNAFGAYPPTTIQGQSDANGTTKFNFQVPYNQYTDLGGIKSLIETGNNNLLKNPGFENSTYSTSWTISNSTGALDTTNEVQGLQGASLTLSAQTGDLLSQSITPSNNTVSQNFEASCRVRTSLKSIQLCSTAGGTEQTCVPVASNDASQVISASFIAPSAGTSVGVKIKATSTETGSIYVDDCYVGQNRNIGSASQAVLMGTVKITGCTGNWNTTSTTFASFPVQTTCVYTTTGNAQAPSTMIPAIKFASLPAGDYMLQYEGLMEEALANGTSSYQFYDGTNTSREESIIGSSASFVDSNSINQTISYTAPQSNVTLQIRGKSSTGVTTRIYGQTAYPGTIKVWYFPNSAQQVYNANQLPVSFSGYHDTNCSWNRGSTTFADYAEDNTCTFTTRTARNIQVTSPIVTTGLIPQVVFTPSRTGMYRVCASFEAYNSTTASATTYQMIDSGSNVMATKATYTALVGASTTVMLCGITNVTSVTAWTVKLQGKAATGTNYLEPNATNTLDWTIDSLDQNTAAPILVGSVTSNTSGSERIERAYVAPTCTSTPCTIASQSGSWLTSITRSSIGSYAINYPASTFLSAPTCTCNAISTTANPWCQIVATPTTTATTIQTYTSAGASDAGINIICMGPRR